MSGVAGMTTLNGAVATAARPRAAGTDRQPRVVTSGATRNFFKVGHTTLHTIARRYPGVAMRLGVPDVADAMPACDGAPVEFVEWDRSRPDSIHPVLADCTAMLMVPPIQDRPWVGKMYVEAAQRAGIEYICCLGVQFHDTALTLAREANELANRLAASGIPHTTLHLPMFLENLLYQVPSVGEQGVLRYPADPDAPFSYVNCWDLGDVCARLLAGPGPREVFPDTHWTALTQTTCRELAALLTDAIGRPVRFERSTDDDFTAGLVAKGMSPHAAEGVAQLWRRIDAGADIAATDTFARILGRAPETAAEWVAAHACCFGGPGSATCAHPKPPRDHMV